MRSYQFRKGWIRIFLMVVMTVVLSGNVLAASATKPINSVSIKISSKLEAGMSLPEIEIGSGTPSDGEVYVSSSGSTYSVSAAEWTNKTNTALKSADAPKMKITLTPTDVSEAYFLASYKKSSIKITGGSFISARRSGDDLVVTLSLSGIKGVYDPPADAYWNEDKLGQAQWEKPDNTSGYYEVQLYRDGKSVYKVDQVSAIQYNFYPYMTQAGIYTFKVRTIPVSDEQKKYGTKSDWVESGDLQITDRYVSDGKGQQTKSSTAKKGTTDVVGWFQEGKTYFYRFPDNSLARGGWYEIDGQWYYFDVEGKMLTGWQQVSGDWYYLYPSGQMAVGWAQISGKWYFFSNGQESKEPLGSMCSSGWQVIGPYYYYFNDDGSMYTGWLLKDGSWYYLNTVDNSLQGAMFTGWFVRDNKTYFADSNGAVVEGWYEIDGNWYYFYPGTKEMAVSTDINGFYVDENGVWNR